MANTDYTIRGSGLICPTATSFSTVSPGQLVIPFAGYRSASATVPAVGSAVMLNEEIMRLDNFNATDGMITVARGCADTVPALHAGGAILWFFDAAFGTDSREYMATETIGVKLLMRTNGAEMELKNSPPNQLTFNSRFIRPYPPGKLLVNGLAFFLPFVINSDSNVLNISWAHRDRITEDDQLIGHEVGNIGPEAGTTYIVRVYKANNTLVRTTSGIVGTTLAYTLAQAVDDLDALTDAAPGYITLFSERDGLESMQGYRIDFSVKASGWGYAWGAAWGN